MSNQEKARPRVGPELEDDWEYAGISVFASFEQAVTRALTLHGRLGWFVVCIRVPPAIGVTGRAGRGGHYTLGPPAGQPASACFWPLCLDTRAIPH